MENKKLKEKLNDALKRIVILERRLSQNLETNTMSFVSSANSQPNRVERKFLILNCNCDLCSLPCHCYVNTKNYIFGNSNDGLFFTSGPGITFQFGTSFIHHHYKSNRFGSRDACIYSFKSCE